jgi:hypothetical protein
MQSASDMLGGLVLITAELYQSMPLKDACLRHCRAPPGLQCSKSTLSRSPRRHATGRIPAQNFDCQLLRRGLEKRRPNRKNLTELATPPCEIFFARVGLIDAGLVPMVFWEGDCTSRLEVIADVPRATCIYQIERSDIFRAKEILKDIVRLRGNVPPSVLIAGTTDDVREYCRKLIDVVGRGGGFILEGATSVPNEARPENVFAMYEMAKTYGRY